MAADGSLVSSKLFVSGCLVPLAEKRTLKANSLDPTRMTHDTTRTGSGHNTHVTCTKTKITLLSSASSGGDTIKSLRGAGRDAVALRLLRLGMLT